MYRRYREYRQRRRRTTQRRPRSIMKRPGVQIAILIIVALVIYLLLQSGGSGSKSLPDEFGMREAYGKYQSHGFLLEVHTVEQDLANIENRTMRGFVALKRHSQRHW